MNLFIMELEQKVHGFLNIIGTEQSYKSTTLVPALANIWYYYITSLSKIFTQEQFE